MAKSRTRVPEATPDHINRRIERQTEVSVAYFAQHRDEIDARLRELDREWDIERMLEANAAGFGLAGVMLGTLDRRWLLLPMAVTAFLMQHAIEGWCPPLAAFRRLGVRTRAEIAEERYALKKLRGDFDEVKGEGRGGKAAEGRGLAASLLTAVRR